LSGSIEPTLGICICASVTVGIIAYATIIHTITTRRLFRLFIVGILPSRGVSADF
jgi:hypothetical protein